MGAIRKGQVIVITGASSGIGRATAIEFARKGCRLVLVSRDPERLEEVGDLCIEHGAEECLIVPADVVDSDAIEEVADAAVARWSRLDVWINNAGVGSLGDFTEVPVEEHRRVIETNLIGYINGAHAAPKVFKHQKEGVLINNASVSARLATPYLASYTAAKFGVRGLTHGLRQDLALKGFKKIHVCQVNPGVIDTPAFSKAANHSGAPVPRKFNMNTAGSVARAIVSLVERPRREIYVGAMARLGGLAYTLLPTLTASVLVLSARFLFVTSKKGQDDTSGNLFRPVHKDADRDPSITVH